MDAAGKQHVDVGCLGGFAVLKQHVNHLLPKREARNRPDVAATFPAFKDEATGALLQVHLQQCWRRRVDICRNAFGFEMCGLVGASAGDQGIAGLAGQHGLDLFLTQLLGHETQQADAPGAIADSSPCVLE